MSLSDHSVPHNLADNEAFALAGGSRAAIVGVDGPSCITCPGCGLRCTVTEEAITMHRRFLCSGCAAIIALDPDEADEALGELEQDVGHLLLSLWRRLSPRLQWLH